MRQNKEHIFHSGLSPALQTIRQFLSFYFQMDFSVFRKPRIS